MTNTNVSPYLLRPRVAREVIEEARRRWPGDDVRNCEMRCAFMEGARFAMDPTETLGAYERLMAGEGKDHA